MNPEPKASDAPPSEPSPGTPDPDREHRIDELKRKLAAAENFAAVARAERRRRVLRGAFAASISILAVAALVVMAQTGLLGGIGIGKDDAAPDFRLLDSEGTEFHLASTHGEPRVLFFMTSSDWCAPCKVMTRGPLRQLSETYGDRITMLSIEMIPNERFNSDLNEYKGRYNASWPHARDTADVARAYDVVQLSIVVILDPDGVVRAKAADPSYDTMVRVLEGMGYPPTEEAPT